MKNRSTYLVRLPSFYGCWQKTEDRGVSEKEQFITAIVVARGKFRRLLSPDSHKAMLKGPGLIPAYIGVCITGEKIMNSRNLVSFKR